MLRSSSRLSWANLSPSYPKPVFLPTPPVTILPVFMVAVSSVWDTSSSPSLPSEKGAHHELSGYPTVTCFPSPFSVISRLKSPQGQRKRRARRFEQSVSKALVHTAHEAKLECFSAQKRRYIMLVGRSPRWIQSLFVGGEAIICDLVWNSYHLPSPPT